MFVSSRWQTSTVKHHVVKTHPETCSDISGFNNSVCLLVFQTFVMLVSDALQKVFSIFSAKSETKVSTVQPVHVHRYLSWSRLFKAWL